MRTPKPPEREAAPRHRDRSGRRAVLDELSRLASSELSGDYILDFYAQITLPQNDRGAALLLARHLEDALAFSLIRRLKINQHRLGDLMGIDRPLSSFDNKTRLAHSIGLISDNTRNLLDVIRAIRNAFAHALIPISFDTSEVAAVCALLHPAPEPYPPSGTPFRDGLRLSPNRMHYHRACDVLAHNLMVVAGAYVELTRVQPPDSA
jgi:hypothetical protein